MVEPGRQARLLEEHPGEVAAAGRARPCTSLSATSLVTPAGPLARARQTSAIPPVAMGSRSSYRPNDRTVRRVYPAPAASGRRTPRSGDTRVLSRARAPPPPLDAVLGQSRPEALGAFAPLGWRPWSPSSALDAERRRTLNLDLTEPEVSLDRGRRPPGGGQRRGGPGRPRHPPRGGRHRSGRGHRAGSGAPAQRGRRAAGRRRRRRRGSGSGAPSPAPPSRWPASRCGSGSAPSRPTATGPGSSRHWSGAPPRTTRSRTGPSPVMGLRGPRPGRFAAHGTAAPTMRPVHQPRVAASTRWLANHPDGPGSSRPAGAAGPLG